MRTIWKFEGCALIGIATDWRDLSAQPRAWRSRMDSTKKPQQRKRSSSSDSQEASSMAIEDVSVTTLAASRVYSAVCSL